MHKAKEILELHNEIVYGHADWLSAKRWGNEEEANKFFAVKTSKEIKFQRLLKELAESSGSLDGP